MTYFYDMQQQGPHWQNLGQFGLGQFGGGQFNGQIGPQFAQQANGWLGNPGMAAYGQQYGQYGAQPFGAFGHNAGWGMQPQWGTASPWGPWGQHRQLSPYDVNEVVRQLVPALPQIIAQAQQPYGGIGGYAAYGQAPRTLTPQDVNEVVRQLLPLLPQIVGSLQGLPQQQFAMHGGIGGGGFGQSFGHQGYLGAQNPFGTQNPFAASFQQPWQYGALGQHQHYGVPQFQSAFGSPQQWGQQWGQGPRQLTQQDVADVTRQLAVLIPQVISNLQSFNQQRVM
jgi:hypothetical protein